MQFRIIEKKAKDRGRIFAGKLLDMTWTVKVWTKAQDPDADDPVFEKDLKHDYSRSAASADPDKQDAVIDAFLEKEAKEVVAAYLNEQSLLVDKHITDRAGILKTKLDSEFGAI